jgi:hypothetical protein
VSHPFLGRAALVDFIRSRERTHAIQKREGLTNRPVRFTICGCPDPGCAGWHTIVMDRSIPTPAECEAILKAHNRARKSGGTRRACQA